MKVYKTKEFARLARKAGVDDQSLGEAVARAEKGLIDATIGKFLIKQRVARRNEGRSGGFRTIAFHRLGDRAVFLHLFCEKCPRQPYRCRIGGLSRVGQTLGHPEPRTDQQAGRGKEMDRD